MSEWPKSGVHETRYGVPGGETLEASELLFSNSSPELRAESAATSMVSQGSWPEGLHGETSSPGVTWRPGWCVSFHPVNG